jgi:hypothetical protein
MPGVVDPQIHVSNVAGVPNGAVGHRMMAKVGVITGVDVMGPIDDVITGIRDQGAGLNVACCDALIHRSPNNDPSTSEIEATLERALGAGTIGLKVAGGGRPLTPDAT